MRQPQKIGRESFLRIDTRQEIAAQVEAERPLADSNRKLIEIVEAKIKAKRDEIWG
jgi:hypothetical protein